MQSIHHYASPLGGILLAADGEGLTGLWFEGQKHFACRLDPAHGERDLPVFRRTAQWLDLYFSGQEPDFTPPLHLTGTDFQNEVWKLLLEIPYGKTATYGGLALELARRRGDSPMSARAVGGAVGRNPISVIIPCHRVVGSSGSLTGYAGGLEKKRRLLTLEGADLTGLFTPEKETAI